MEEESGNIWQEFENQVRNFLDNSVTNSAILELLSRGKKRIDISIDDLRAKNSMLARMVLNQPAKAIEVFERVLKSISDELSNQNNFKERGFGGDHVDTNLRVAFDGSFGKHMVTPRGLRSSLVNKFVAVRGIVTSISRVKPKLLRSFHYCESTKKPLVKEYFDKYQLVDDDKMGTNNTVPMYDEARNPLSMEYGYCRYKDIQTITIQEMPENAPTGQLSRSVEIILQNDLVDLTKPGDRIQVNGIYKPLSGSQTFSIGTFKALVIATSIKVLNSQSGQSFSASYLRDIKKMSKRADVFDLMSRSLAPSIYGHQFIKQGALLQLLGGVEKNLTSGTRLRGDVNMLLIGDPGTAKSQFLRHMLNISPLSFSTTGRGSSGVGLTAAITIDKDTGEKQLEAGAMVLADKGIICIDEFDKMSQLDRVAMHEVMEQQTVTIAKAGIHVSLNARCSVLAAANPIYGEFIRNKPINVNIGLPDSLLSRFDLIYTVLDRKDPEHDRLVSEKVTNNHRVLGPNLFLSFFNNNTSSGVIEQGVEEDKKDFSVFEKFNDLIHDSREQELLTRPFLQQYIAYAKLNCKPQLTNESSAFLNQKWSELRQRDYENMQNAGSSRVMPVTVRTLESMIRLSTAHAKCRLNDTVDIIDCLKAVELIVFTLFGVDDEDTYGENVIRTGEDGKMEEEQSSHQAGGNGASERSKPTRQRDNIEEGMEAEYVDPTLQTQYEVTMEHQKVVFKSLVILNKANKEKNVKQITYKELFEHSDKEFPGVVKGIEHLNQIVKILEDSNKLVKCEEVPFENSTVYIL